MFLSSTNNEKVKTLLHLNDKKYRDINNEFIVEGFHSVNEAYKNNLLKQIILLENEICNIDVDTMVVNKKVMDYIYKLPSTPKILGIVKKLPINKIKSKVIILDNIQDPGNLGTIIRSAVAFNFDTIILSNDSIDIYNKKVLRATEGMIFNLNIIRTDIINQIQELKNNGFSVYGTDVNNGICLEKVSFNEKTAIVLGNEGTGIKADVKNICDKFININMNELCESLNVGVAGSIIMYEVNK